MTYDCSPTLYLACLFNLPQQNSGGTTRGHARSQKIQKATRPSLFFCIFCICNVPSPSNHVPTFNIGEDILLVQMPIWLPEFQVVYLPVNLLHSLNTNTSSDKYYPILPLCQAPTYPETLWSNRKNLGNQKSKQGTHQSTCPTPCVPRFSPQLPLHCCCCIPFPNMDIDPMIDHSPHQLKTKEVTENKEQNSQSNKTNSEISTQTIIATNPDAQTLVLEMRKK